MRKGSSFFVWFMISGVAPILGPVAAAARTDPQRLLCLTAVERGRAVRHYDAICLRCGTELEYPHEAELIEPDPSLRVRARL